MTGRRKGRDMIARGIVVIAMIVVKEASLSGGAASGMLSRVGLRDPIPDHLPTLSSLVIQPPLLSDRGGRSERAPVVKAEPGRRTTPHRLV